MSFCPFRACGANLLSIIQGVWGQTSVSLIQQKGSICYALLLSFTKIIFLNDNSKYLSYN